MAGSRVDDVVSAAVNALQDDSTLETLLGGSSVGTYVDQNTDPPYVVVMGSDELPWAVTFEQFSDTTVGDEGDNGGRTVDVLCQCVSTKKGTQEVDRIASRVLEVLTSEDTWADLDDFQLAEFVRNTALLPTDLFVVGTLWYQRQVVVRVTVG